MVRTAFSDNPGCKEGEAETRELRKAVTITVFCGEVDFDKVAAAVDSSPTWLEMVKDRGDCVIVHELLHLAVSNHGKLWKCLMRAHLGEYEECEKWRRVS